MCPIEETADAVVVGKQKKKQAADTKVAMGRKMGTKSLQIPLLDNQKGGDLPKLPNLIWNTQHKAQPQQVGMKHLLVVGLSTIEKQKNLQS